ncbi:zinc ribbon domain-containing protein [Oribacterium sp. oral taxon 108]|uniref:zinc ribbon domain-containing protein n=1 Tax=Oribacterium sp. oral taxon 108 TaxID=712414 RepID=UPI00030BE706|nr:zinc ribbon domain-containing protein [Oribacterium sp. oral taxon 108]
MAKYLEDSSIVMKTKTNPEKGSYQASLLFNLMGEDVLDAYGEYGDGKLGLAFPSLEKKFYQGELQSILSNSSDEEIELPNFNKKENRKLAEKLFKKYGSLLSEFFTEENFTVEKGSFKTLVYGVSTNEEKEFKGTVYTFQPSAEDLEGILEKFADKLEKDEDCAKFLIQSGLGIMISENIGYDEFIDESRLADFADWLRENAEELAEELEEKHIKWVLTMEGNQVQRIQVGADREDNGEIDEGEDEVFLDYISILYEKQREEYFLLKPNGSPILQFHNVYKDKGSTFEGRFSFYSSGIPTSPYILIEYSVEKGKKDKILSLPYGEYDFSDALGYDGPRGKMTVKAGKKNSTDYEIKISGLEEDDLPGIKTLSIHVNAKEGADLSRPKGKTVDISDYTLYEVKELGEEFSEELSNIGEEIFGN